MRLACWLSLIPLAVLTGLAFAGWLVWQTINPPQGRGWKPPSARK